MHAAPRSCDSTQTILLPRPPPRRSHLENDVLETGDVHTPLQRVQHLVLGAGQGLQGRRPTGPPGREPEISQQLGVRRVGREVVGRGGA